MSELKRPTRVVVVDADNPLEEVHGEFFWREDHERVLASARDAAYRAGYQDGVAAGLSSAAQGTVRVRVRRRPRLVFGALISFVVLAYLVGLASSSMR